MVQGPTSSDRLRLCAVRSSWPFALQWLIERRDVFLDAYFIQKSRGFLFTYRLSIFPTSVHDAFLTRRSLIAATGDPYLLSPLNARFLSPYLLTCLSGDNACEAVLEFRPINLVPNRIRYQLSKVSLQVVVREFYKKFQRVQVLPGSYSWFVGICYSATAWVSISPQYGPRTEQHPRASNSVRKKRPSGQVQPFFPSLPYAKPP
jgi:hypothetical protein